MLVKYICIAPFRSYASAACYQLLAIDPFRLAEFVVALDLQGSVETSNNYLILLKYLIKKLTLEKLNGFGQFMTQTDPSNTPAPKMVKRLVTKSDNDCFSMMEMQSNLAWSG